MTRGPMLRRPLNRVNPLYPNWIETESSAIAQWRADDYADGIAELRAYALRPSDVERAPDGPQLSEQDIADVFVFGPAAIGRDVIPMDTLLDLHRGREHGHGHG